MDPVVTTPTALARNKNSDDTTHCAHARLGLCLAARSAASDTIMPCPLMPQSDTCEQSCYSKASYEQLENKPVVEYIEYTYCYSTVFTAVSEAPTTESQRAGVTDLTCRSLPAACLPRLPSVSATVPPAHPMTLA